MSVTVRQIGDAWIVEVDGCRVGQVRTEAEAEALVVEWRAKQSWVASWRFC